MVQTHLATLFTALALITCCIVVALPIPTHGSSSSQAHRQTNQEHQDSLREVLDSHIRSYDAAATSNEFNNMFSASQKVPKVVIQPSVISRSPSNASQRSSLQVKKTYERGKSLLPRSAIRLAHLQHQDITVSVAPSSRSGRESMHIPKEEQEIPLPESPVAHWVHSAPPIPPHTPNTGEDQQFEFVSLPQPPQSSSRGTHH